MLKKAEVTTGAFALVLALIAWLYLASVALVISAQINVVRNKKLYPRALLTPFTDNVDLTHGDQRAYTDAARARRSKGFEKVDVSFEHGSRNESNQPDANTSGR